MPIRIPGLVPAGYYLLVLNNWSVIYDTQCPWLCFGPVDPYWSAMTNVPDFWLNSALDQVAKHLWARGERRSLFLLRLFYFSTFLLICLSLSPCLMPIQLHLAHLRLYLRSQSGCHCPLQTTGNVQWNERCVSTFDWDTICDWEFHSIQPFTRSRSPHTINQSAMFPVNSVLSCELKHFSMQYLFPC